LERQQWHALLDDDSLSTAEFVAALAQSVEYRDVGGGFDSDLPPQPDPVDGDNNANTLLGGDAADDHIRGNGGNDKLLSYDFPRLPRQKGATARHAIYGGQWRGSDREKLGRLRRRAVVGSPPSSSSVLNGYPGFAARMTRQGSG
jgi:hypothetical protein